MVLTLSIHLFRQQRLIAWCAPDRTRVRGRKRSKGVSVSRMGGISPGRKTPQELRGAVALPLCRGTYCFVVYQFLMGTPFVLEVFHSVAMQPLLLWGVVPQPILL